MSIEGRAMIAKKACTRCSKSKKRCDRAIPGCRLCTRFGRRCEYEDSMASSLGPTPSQSPGLETFLASEPITLSHLKNAVIHKLGPFTPESAVSAYHQAIEPWFPITSELRGRLRPTWDETSLDVTLLCLSILLLTTSPSSTAESDGNTSELETLYLQTKSSLALAEGLGFNSFPIVQSRILTTLFEVSHGFYPAAYISIGATLRAADALEVHPRGDALQPHYSDGAVSHEETILIWCGILVLDRYITIESGPRSSLTRSRIGWLHNLLKPALCPTHEPNQDKNSPVSRFARLMEASAMIDKIHTTINSPTSDQIFNIEEMMLTVKTSIALQTILTEEILAEDRLYSGGLGLCQIALLLAYENGTKVSSSANATENWNSLATTSLIRILSTITSTIELFTMETRSIDFNYFPPLVTFLVYKAAMIITERLSIELDVKDGLARLRTLRKFLRIVAKRWLSCERYLKLLNEDTTPRMLKAIEQGQGSF
ncbi:hypothetical protein P152DRAFT_516511 [Eremomyces bilateralis CBS 781.70]|uniref:Zn(2)-C6 fungal-type domain-containing protein n=1 Tax=Eremomyces bilateralis CBS 781.70 TaxID=1392243 RepID=A0A6G1FVU4_9PEZI|nr:uncharacterized protein P152DRAFT_516511 [Eremomyces bilateralis CBS 781.70]KAF1809826.1 hypothetical protein P152DRAFT_516511 [Eremomyces bilateralis CBS 781.70]